MLHLINAAPSRRHLPHRQMNLSHAQRFSEARRRCIRAGVMNLLTVSSPRPPMGAFLSRCQFRSSLIDTTGSRRREVPTRRNSAQMHAPRASHRATMAPSAGNWKHKPQTCRHRTELSSNTAIVEVLAGRNPASPPRICCGFSSPGVILLGVAGFDYQFGQAWHLRRRSEHCGRNCNPHSARGDRQR